MPNAVKGQVIFGPNGTAGYGDKELIQDLGHKEWCGDEETRCQWLKK